MRRMMNLLIAGMLVFGIYMNVAATAKAADKAPAPKAPVAVQPNQPPDAAAKPQVSMDPNAVAVLPTDSWDFGSVYDGKEVLHDFIIKNGGTADLKIINVKSG